MANSRSAPRGNDGPSSANGFPRRRARHTAAMATGIATRTTASTALPSIGGAPDHPIPITGAMLTSIIGSRIPKANTAVHGTVRDSAYLSPMVLTAHRATSDASRRAARRSGPSGDSDAQMQSMIACLYPEASSSRPETASDSASFTPREPLVSALRTASPKIPRDRGGPSAATVRTASSRDPPDSVTEVRIPTTVGPSFIRRR